MHVLPFREVLVVTCFFFFFFFFFGVLDFPKSKCNLKCNPTNEKEKLKGVSRKENLPGKINL